MVEIGGLVLCFEIFEIEVLVDNSYKCYHIPKRRTRKDIPNESLYPPALRYVELHKQASHRIVPIRRSGASSWELVNDKVASFVVGNGTGPRTHVLTVPEHPDVERRWS